jgi:pyruvate dehydrogenase E1 component beta subunit
MIQALNRALAEELERDERVMVLGEDVGKEGGIFRVTDGLQKRFGAERVVDTPLAESAIVGASLGLAIGGMRPVPEIQFEAFAWYAFHQIEHHVARMRWRSRGRFTAPMVLRTPYGAGIHALEHHSESREAYFAHTPGLKVVVPRSPRLARALLKASVRDEDPVVFLEPAALYRAKEDVPAEEEPRALGRAEVVREGSDLTLVGYGAMLPRALDAARELERDGARAEVLDLVTLAPLDRRAIHASVRKTGRCVVVHEAPLMLGMGAEVAATLADESLEYLEAPIKRVTGYDVPVPLFAREESYLPTVERIVEAAREVLAF